MTTWIRSGAVAAIGSFALGLSAASAAAQQPAQPPPVAASQVAAARARFRDEPPVRDVVQHALQFFRVHPEELDSLRSRARQRAYLPNLALGYRFDDNRFARHEETFVARMVEDEDTNARVHAVSVGFVWDLRDLVFNPFEVQTYGIVGVQRDVMLEVARNYFVRRQLLLRLLLRPPQDPVARASMELQVEEFTALLDTHTGGWFSRAVEMRRRGHGR